MTSEPSAEPRWHLQGRRVSLRPVEAADIPLLHRWQNDPAVAGQWSSVYPMAFSQLEHLYMSQPAVGDERGAFMVVQGEDVAVGLITYHRIWSAPHSPGYNLGISIAPEHRHQGFGSEAQRLLADYLLSALPVGRVEAGTDIENTAEQRALERAGFSREGVLRSAWWREGRWHDMVLYSRVQGDA
ncbi:MAG: GNAT family N-acetyltransferase [Ktedonobacterales bacterium]